MISWFSLEPAAAVSHETEAVRTDSGQTAGRRFQGNYEILGEIVRGGMGVVYRARQTNVGRLVALKMIQGSAVASPVARLRFQLETTAIGRLDHPNIVSLIESGEHNGELFYTMSLVEGRSLAQLSAECARRDAGWLRRSATLLSTVAHAIHYAHQRGVLHRDLKPSNILVDDNNEPKITDFGLAKIRESDAGLTRTESLLGSPNYMAPEQAAGPAHLVTTAADLHSLGAILYELICGSPPFEAPTAIETMRRVVDDTPETPRRRNPAVDRDLESICLKCLEKEPQHRYASAADLGADLDRWLAGRPIQARPMSRFERTWRWCRRNPALTSLTALSMACIVVLAIGAGVALHRIQAANRESQALLRRLQLDQVESYFAEGDSARGIALLAHLLRAQPEDKTVGVRLKSALELRPIARPFAQPWLSGSEILALGFNPAASQGVALSRQGELHVRNLETGRVSTLRLADDQPLAHGALSPDAGRLATAHPDGTVMLWNVARPLTPHARLPHPGPIRFLQFDRAGALLATGCDDGAVRMWSIIGDDQTRTLEPFPNAIWVIGFDAAGTQLAAGTVDGSVRIWQGSRPANTTVELFFAAALTDLQFSPDGSMIAVAGWSPHATAQVWHTDTGQPAGLPLAHRAHVTAIRFSPDGQKLLTLSHDTTARVWNTADWTPAADALMHVGGVARAVWSSSGRHIATGSYAGVVWWELPGPEPGAIPLHNSGRILAATGSARTDLLLTLSSDATLRDWTSAQSEASRELRLAVDDLSSAVFSSSGRTLAVTSPGQNLHLFDTQSGDAKGGPIHLPGPPSFVAISPLDDILLAGTAEGIIWRFLPSTDTGSRVELCRVEGLQGMVFSPDGRRVATFSSERTARIWDVTSGKPLTPPLLHDGAVEHAAFSPNGTLLATASVDSQARVWQAAQGKLLAGPFPHNARVDQVIFDPSGRFLATTSADGSARIWTIGNHDASPVVIQHGANVGRAVFNSDGSLLLTVSRDGDVRAWDPHSGVPVAEPFRHHVEVQDAGFHPNRHFVWTLTVDGMARLWPLPPYEPAEAEWLPDQAELIGRMYLVPPNRFRVTSTDSWDRYPPAIDSSARD